MSLKETNCNSKFNKCCFSETLSRDGNVSINGHINAKNGKVIQRALVFYPEQHELCLKMSIGSV